MINRHGSKTGQLVWYQCLNHETDVQNLIVELEKIPTSPRNPV